MANDLSDERLAQIKEEMEAFGGEIPEEVQRWALMLVAEVQRLRRVEREELAKRAEIQSKWGDSIAEVARLNELLEQSYADYAAVKGD